MQITGRAYLFRTTEFSRALLAIQLSKPRGSNAFQLALRDTKRTSLRSD